MADNATQKASAAASEAGERVKEKAKEAGDKVKEQGRTFLNEQKRRVGSEIGTYSAAARRAAERLESESDTNLSSYVSSAADQLDRLATRVQERDLGELIDDVEEMARRRPEVFYGGMFVAGLVAARFLKASKEKRARERYQSAGGGRRERSSYETRRPAGRAFGVSPEPVPAQGETEQRREEEHLMADSTFRQSMGTMAQPDGRSESIADLIKDLRDEAMLLVRQEVALAKTEISEKMARILRNTAYAIAGALVAFVGLIFILQAATVAIGIGLLEAGLTEKQSLWASPLILGVIVAIVGAILISKGIAAVKNESLVPEKTVESLKNDKEWIQNKTR